MIKSDMEVEYTQNKRCFVVEVFVQALMVLRLLVKTRLRSSRILRLWTVFSIFAPVVAIAFIAGIEAGGGLSTDDISVANNTHDPVTFAAYSAAPLSNWQADASLLGFGPSDSPDALILGEIVCNRLGVNFAGTRKILNNNEAAGLFGAGLEAIVMFNDLSLGSLNADIYHPDLFFNPFNKYADFVEDLLDGHFASEDENALASGLVELQTAANLAFLEYQGTTIPPADEPEFTAQRTFDFGFTFGNFGIFAVSFLYYFAFFSSTVLIANSITSGVSGQHASNIPQVLKLKGMIIYSYYLAWFMYGMLFSTMSTIATLIFGFALGVFEVTSASIIIQAFLFYGWAIIGFTLFIVSIFGGRKSMPNFMNAIMIFLNMASLVGWIIVFLLEAGFISADVQPEEISEAYFLIPAFAFGMVVFYLPIAHEKTLDQLAPQTETAVIFLIVDIALYVSLALLVTFIWEWLNRSGKRKIVSSKGSSRQKGVYADNLTRKFRVSKEYEVVGTSRTKIKKKKVKETLVAVDNLNLAIEADQIFCLLGQNGAGKTTTFSMLVGSLGPSTGRVTVVGKDMKVGLCPQHDVQFDLVPCIDQLTLMGQLGGLAHKSAQVEALRLLQLLGIGNKAKEVPLNLSGGQRRRLTVAMAAIGNSKLLFMDEPTTGLDPVNRRRIWDLLRTLRRQGRTIVLTTHSMEEAEALADSIAIMSKGKIQASGTSVALRQHYGPWYHLACVREARNGSEAYDLDALFGFVKQHVPTAAVVSSIGSQVSFNLPTEHIDGFPTLFDSLEAKLKEFGLSSFQVSPSTLDDVFMRLAAEEEENEMKKEKFAQRAEVVDGAKVVAFSKEDLVGAAQAESLEFERRPTSSKRVRTIITMAAVSAKRRRSVCAIMAVVCFLYTGLLIWISGQIKGTSSFTLSFPTTIEGDASFVSYSSTVPSEASTDAFMGTADMGFGSFYVPFTSYEDFANVQQSTIITFESLLPKVEARITHGFGQIRELTQVTYNRIASNYSAFGNSVTYTPWRFAISGNSPVATVPLFLIVVAVAQLSTIPGNAMCRARFDKWKEALLMTGVPKHIYWTSYFIWHCCLVLFCLVVQHVVLTLGSVDAVIVGPTIVYVLAILFATPTLVLYGYVWSSFYNRKQKGTSLSYWVNTLPLFPWGIASFAFEEPNLLFEDGMTILFPSFGFYRIYAKFAVLGYNDQTITQDRALDWDFGVGRVYLMFFIGSVLSILYLCFVEYIGFSALFKSRGSKVDPAYSEDDVTTIDQANIDAVLAGILPKPVSALPEGVPIDELIVRTENAGKSFGGQLAVSNATLGTHSGTICGLLGPNGAGKTTLIKCMSGMDGYTFDHGEGYVNDISVTRDLKRAINFMGICPQFDALNRVLTPREHLRYFCRLRGVPSRTIESIVEVYLNDLALGLKADSWVKNLSGGNQRKTSIAMSMVANLPAVFLDEPTTGIDPSTRHKIWEFLIQSSTLQNRSVILTTHSMEEADVLCSRLAIMVQGSIRTAGTPEYLKSIYGGGLVVSLNVSKNAVDDTEAYAESIVSQLTSTSKRIYDDERKESHLFKFSIPSDSKWSTMFGVLSRADNLVDFSIAQKSLEDVFAQMATLQEAS